MDATFPARVARLQSIQGVRPVEARLLTARVLVCAPHSTAHPGVNQIFLVYLDSGDRAFFKPFSGVHLGAANLFGQDDGAPLHECVAWQLAASLGPPYDRLVTVGVLRDLGAGIGLGSLCTAVAGVPGVPDPFSAAPDLVDAAAFFDVLIGQQDRHMGNFRWDAALGRLGLIDHGFAFARPGDFCNASVFADFRHARGASALTADEQALVRRLASDPTLSGLADVLETDRAQALQERTRRMIASNTLLPAGDF